MNAEVWRQVDDVFQAVVELEPARRGAFLDVVCASDPVLRTEVESLLAADSFEWDFIEASAIESAAILLADEEPRLTSGQQLGHYEIKQLIGKGGMGEVYLARDLMLNRNIALKLLPLDYTRNADRLQRFRREAETVSALNHPNIITIHELGSDDGHEFIATELIEGETLREWIKRGPLSVSDALEVAIQVTSALSAAHHTGIVHRDIKPENIMLRPDGYAKVLDFGLAKLAEGFEPQPLATSAERIDVSSGLLMGTLRYMSPEQASGLPVDARSDIFSLGVVFYEMVTSRPPFEDKNPAALVESILKDAPLPLENSLDAVPATLADVVAKMLNKDRKCRYQHAEELLIDLKLLKERLTHDTLDAERTSFGHPPIPWMYEIAIDEGSHVGRKSFISAISTIRHRGSAIPTIVVLAFASVIGYTSYEFLRNPAADPPLAESLTEGTWTTKAPISSPRWHAEPAVLNGILYVSGGWNVCTPFADLESYDPDTDSWTQRAKMRTPRGGHGVGVLVGKLYAVGGSTDCGSFTASVEAYDPASNTWFVKASLPEESIGHTVTAAVGNLYAIGGRSIDGSHRDSNFQYDPSRDTWTEREPLPTARSTAAAAVVNGIIYVIGGRNGTRPLATVEAYDPASNSWTIKSPMLTARHDHAVAELDGIIYAFGGTRDDQVEAYDPVNDTWTVVGRMPARRSYAHAAALRGSIYFAGGSDQDAYSSTVNAFTPDRPPASTAGTCPALDISVMAAMPTARRSMAVGEIGGIIYVAGGYDDDPEFLSTNEAYDPTADTWVTKAPMPGARSTSASAVVDEKLYVIGGNARGRCSDLNQVYDPKTNAWFAKAPMPTPRCHLSAVALDGLIYALGGTNTSGTMRYAIVEVYDPATDSWTAAPEMPTGRLHLAAVALGGKIYAAGGLFPASSTEAFDVLEVYDPTSKTWTTKTHMPTPRAGMAASVVNGSFVVVGGVHNDPIQAAVEAYDPVKDIWTILPNMPIPRVYSGGITSGKSLYLMGGMADLYTPGSLTTNDALTLTFCSN